MEMLLPANCLRFWLLAKELMLKEFEEKVFEFCLRNFKEIPSEAFVEIRQEELYEIVVNRGLEIKTEKDAFDCVMNWILHEPKTRMKHITTLANCVDFTLIEQSVS